MSTLATRGERLVLQRHGLRTDDGTTWEFLAVYQLGDDERVRPLGRKAAAYRDVVLGRTGVFYLSVDISTEWAAHVYP